MCTNRSLPTAGGSGGSGGAIIGIPAYSDGGMTGGGMEYRELKEDQRSDYKLHFLEIKDQRLTGAGRPVACRSCPTQRTKRARLRWHRMHLASEIMNIKKI